MRHQGPVVMMFGIRSRQATAMATAHIGHPSGPLTGMQADAWGLPSTENRALCCFSRLECWDPVESSRRPRTALRADDQVTARLSSSGQFAPSSPD